MELEEIAMWLRTSMAAEAAKARAIRDAGRE